MIAIKLYKNMPSDDENVLKGISLKIPAEVRFNVDTAPDETFTIMTQEQYQAYLVLIEPELQAWKAIQEILPIEGE